MKQPFFVASDGSHGTGRELWKTDGTTNGTVMVANINPTGASSPSAPVVLDGTLYFSASDGSKGAELWKSDGTSTGTMLVKDIVSGSAGSGISSLTVFDGQIFFAANDGLRGTELWVMPDDSDYSDLYYSAGWQVIEERDNGASTASKQYVWSPVYIDAMILRDSDTDVDGTMDQRLYVQQDANFNVTESIDSSGNVVERYLFDPYGQVTITDGSYTPRSGNASSYAWQYLFQGKRRDFAIGLDESRHRVYSPTLMRWMQQDPLLYVDGANIDQFLRLNPINRNDPTGLQQAFPGAPFNMDGSSNLDYTRPLATAPTAKQSDEAREVLAKGFSDLGQGVKNILQGTWNSFANFVSGLQYLPDSAGGPPSYATGRIVPEATFATESAKERGDDPTLTAWGQGLGAFGFSIVAGGVIDKVVSFVRSGARALSGMLKCARSVESTLTREALIRNLAAQGTKHTPENIVLIAKDAGGKIIFLEKGSEKSGLQHIVEKHAAHFAARGISEAQIPEAVMKAASTGKVVGTQGTTRLIYEVEFGGRTQKIAVEVSTNGFIVGADPAH